MGWGPQSYDDNSGGGGPPSPTGFFGSSILVIEEIDENGNTIVIVDDVYTTFTATIPPASPLPTAASTADPNGILQKGQASQATTTPPASPYSEVAPSTSSTPSPSSSPPPQSSQSTPDSQSSADNQPQKDDHGGSPPIGAMVVAPLAVIAGLVILFFFWRRRRAARRNGMVSHEKVRSAEDGLSSGPPGYSESTNGLLMTPAAAATPLSARGANNALAPSSSRLNRSSQAPVILNTNMRDGAYLTGIDTSDAVSLASGTGLTGGQSSRPRGSIDATSMGSADEPPPPYRPRSVPSISRETSLRHPNEGLAINTDLTAVAEQNPFHSRDEDDDDLTPTVAPRHNPFDDPEDDDDRGGSTPVQSPRWSRRSSGGGDDARSMISQFSFEHEHR